MKAKSYLFRVVIFSLFISFFVLALNFFTDPFGITGAPRIAHVNQYKVDSNEHSRLMKKYQPLFSSHNALVVGNSRVELGINPSHRCFIRKGMDVYNLGIPGADVRTQLAYAMNLIHQQPINAVFLSVDFTDYISPNPQNYRYRQGLLDTSAGEFRLTAAGEPDTNYRRVFLQDHLKALFSLDALLSSVRTIVLQSNTAADRDEAGFNPARDFEEAVRIEGPQALFEQKMSDLRKNYATRWYVRDADGRLDPAFDDLQAFLNIAAERGIAVVLFTNPFHQEFWDMLTTLGYLPLYEDWRQSLEALVRKHDEGSVEFWDFSQDSPYIHEVVPDAGVQSGPLQFFWEPAHYRQELGSLMIDAMMSESCDTEVVFGRRVF